MVSLTDQQAMTVWTVLQTRQNTLTTELYDHFCCYIESQIAQGHAFDAHHEVVCRVGPHGHEGARAQGHLSAIAHQDVQAQGSQRQDEEGDEDGAEGVLVCHHGHGKHGQRQHQPDGGAVLGDGEDLLVSPVAGLELTVLAVEHGCVPFTRDR
jgi:hypothetical protein